MWLDERRGRRKEGREGELDSNSVFRFRLVSLNVLLPLSTTFLIFHNVALHLPLLPSSVSTSTHSSFPTTSSSIHLLPSPRSSSRRCRFRRQVSRR